MQTVGCARDNIHSHALLTVVRATLVTRVASYVPLRRRSPRVLCAVVEHVARVSGRDYCWGPLVPLSCCSRRRCGRRWASRGCGTASPASRDARVNKCVSALGSREAQRVDLLSVCVGCSSLQSLCMPGCSSGHCRVCALCRVIRLPLGGPLLVTSGRLVVRGTGDAH